MPKVHSNQQDNLSGFGQNSCEKQDGLGILFQDMLIQEIRNKVFKVLEIPGLALTVQSYIIYYKDRPLSPPAKDFLTLLRKRVHRSL